MKYALLLTLCSLITATTLLAQPSNDDCRDALVLDLCFDPGLFGTYCDPLVLDYAGATTDTFSELCNDARRDGVWFSMTLSQPALRVYPINLESYSASLFRGDCDDLRFIGCQEDRIFGGFQDLQAGDYLLHIALPDSVVTDSIRFFINEQVAANECVSSQWITIVGRELDLPLDQPLIAGEEVTFRYKLDWRVDDPGVGNNCQWLQGIVPVFNEGWEYNTLSEGTIRPSSFWGWYEDGDVEYNLDNITMSTYTEGGRIKLAHYLINRDHYDVSSTLKSETALPAGWYATSEGQGDTSCIWPSNDPDETYGYPTGVCGIYESFSVEFTVKLRQDYHPSMGVDMFMFTFSDGATGCWTHERCGLDAPAYWSGEVKSPCSVFGRPDTTIEVSPFAPFSYTIPIQQAVDSVYYEVVTAKDVIGATGGSGNTIEQQLIGVPTGASPAYVIYRMVAVGADLECNETYIRVEIEKLTLGPVTITLPPSSDSIITDLSSWLWSDAEVTWMDELGRTGHSPMVRGAYPDITTLNVVAKQTNPAGDVALHHFIIKKGKAQEDVGLNVYPNPTTDELSIEAASPITNIELQHMTGAVDVSSRAQFEGANATLAMNGLASGVYYLIVYNGSARHMEKVIKL